MRTVTRVLLALAVLAAFLPTANAVSYGTYGGKVLPSSTDFNPLYAALPGTPTICSRDTGVAATASDNLYYLNMDGAGTIVATFDVRLTTAGGFSAGTIVGSGDSDSGQSFDGLACTAFAASVGYVESDGLPGHSPGDQVLWSTDAVLGTGDIRLSTSTPQDGSAVTAGTYVGADQDVSAFADRDGLYPDCPGHILGPTGTCSSTSGILDQGQFALRFFDANIDTAFNTGDSLFAAHAPGSSPATASPTINDLYLHAGAGGTFGTKVARSSADYLAEPTVVTPVVATIGTASGCSPLVIHFPDALGAAAATIQMDDVVLYSATSCTGAPFPSSAVTAGTRVSTTTHHQGSALTPAAGVALAGLIYFVDANGNGYQDSSDPVYLHRTIALGGSVDALPQTGVVSGDLRLTAVTAGSSSFSVGTIVDAGATNEIGTFSASKTSAHADINGGTKSWFVRLLNQDGARETPLQAGTLIRYVDLGTTSQFDAGTDSVYLDAGTTASAVDASDTLLFGAGAAVTTALVSSSDFKLSGGDGTFDLTRSESVYFSKDAFVNEEDLRLAIGTGVTLTDNAAPDCTSPGVDVDCVTGGVHSGDLLQFSWCVTASSCFGRLQVNDLQVSPTLGTRTGTTPGQDFVPTLVALPTDGGRLMRQNLGESSSIVDDVFYISGGSTTAVTTNAVRITPQTIQSKAAGTFVVTGDSIDLASGATSSHVDATTKTAASLIKFRDTDGLGGYTLNDLVYMDLDAPAVSTATAGALNVADIRLSTQSSQSLTAGTFVLAGNTDLNAGTAFGSGAFTLAYFDENLNGALDNGDMLYAIPPSPVSTSQPVVGAVYLAGSGGATTGGSSGGGSNPVTPVVTTTTTSSTTASSSSSSTSTSTSTSQTQTNDLVDIPSANLAIAASLEVERKDGENRLTWSVQSGVAGYQVFSSDSPFVLLTTLSGDSTNSFTDDDGGKDTKYLVTAYLAGDELSADDVNNGAVPGYSGVPAGQESEDGNDRGFIPGAGLVAVLAALAAAFVVVRRRL